jgi:MoxR-like ATPase
MLTTDQPPLRYTGDKQQTKTTILRNGTPETLYPYLPAPDLVQAVNLALLLEKPLLVMGEPGCGKSLLAKAIAFELYDHNLYDYYEEWPVKSSSKAKDGLYEFDQLRRLRDATTPGTMADITNMKRYVRLGPVGRAFKRSVSHEKRVVLLIDEIDKADIDFPNDLLNELDRMEFQIPELETDNNETDDSETATNSGNEGLIQAKCRPIVIITSNSEKELPDAFLRRCLFHYIEPLSREKLKEIVEGRYYSGEVTEEPIVERSLDVFLDLRKTIKAELLSIGKNISTSEYLDWFEALKHFDDLKKQTPEGTTVNQLLQEVQKLDYGDLKKFPFHSVLLKNLNSVLRFNESTAAR